MSVRILVLALVGCGPGVLAIDDLPTDPDPMPTDVEGPGYPGGIRFETSIRTDETGVDQLVVEVFHGNSLYEYGFADRAGYAEEDCREGRVCHPIGRTGAVLTRAAFPAEGSRTAWDFAGGPNQLTHVVYDTVQPYCWVWGAEPARFAEEDCLVWDPDAPPPDPDPDPDPPATPAPVDPQFAVILTDGDGQPDVDGELDDDTITLVIEDGDGEGLLFGWGQTQVGPVNGWFGEDCFTGDYCHPTGPDGLVLHRVGIIGAIVEGSTTLLPVDFPASATPGITWIVLDPFDADRCWVGGHQPSYYASLGCTVP